RFAHADSSKNRMSGCSSSSSVRSCREIRPSLMSPPDGSLLMDRCSDGGAKPTASRLRREAERLLHERLEEEVRPEGLQHPLHLALVRLDRAELELAELGRQVEADAELLSRRDRRRVRRVVDVETVQTGNEPLGPLRSGR